MVHISPGGENFMDFLELRQVLSSYDGDLRDPLLGLQAKPVSGELQGATREYSPVGAGA